MEQLLSISLFFGFGLMFVLVNLTVGKLVRPNMPHREKAAIYECGEPTVGSSWVQFDLRFYIVALFYLVFDVEVALIYPWAVVFREFPGPALIIGAPFLLVIVIGFAYEWYSGSLDWVRAHVSGPVRETMDGDLARIARRDPEALANELAITRSRH